LSKSVQLKDIGYDQSFATNALKRLMNQLEERILQTNQLKNASKRFAASLIVLINYWFPVMDIIFVLCVEENDNENNKIRKTFEFNKKMITG